MHPQGKPEKGQFFSSFMISLPSLFVNGTDLRNPGSKCLLTTSDRCPQKVKTVNKQISGFQNRLDTEKKLP